MLNAPNYRKTNGLVDLINRRAMWGDVRGRIVGIILDEDGAYAEFQVLNKTKIHQIPVDRLRLVPNDSLPVEDRIASDPEVSTSP